MISLVLAASCALFVTLLLAQTVLRHIYNYAIKDDSIIIVFLSVPIWKIHGDDIAVINRQPLKEAWKPGLATFTTLRLGNRLWGEILAINKKKGFFRSIIITPDDTQHYIEWFEAYKNKKVRPASTDESEPYAFRGFSG